MEILHKLFPFSPNFFDSMFKNYQVYQFSKLLYKLVRISLIKNLKIRVKENENV